MVTVGALSTITPLMIRIEDGKTSLLTYQAHSRPDRKKYVIGRDVLFVRRPDDLPEFFRKIGHLALWSKTSRAKARQLMREAVVAVGSGEGMSYRLRANQTACLRRLPVPHGIEQWVAAEARTIAKKLRKEQEEAEERRKRLAQAQQWWVAA